jgi:CHAT domain-containing protein
LSWIDIADRGVRADLVVLNACELGDGGKAVDGNFSFASAISQAGARQVVASLWPISDTASAVWVPAFYTVLTADSNHNVAQALRAAQRKLRESRMFRHPFYWAGLQTFVRMPIPPIRTIDAADSATRRVRSVAHGFVQSAHAMSW